MAAIDFYVYGIIDANNNKHQAIVMGEGECICIEAFSHLGSPEWFENDAYRLQEWATFHGFPYFKYGYQWPALGQPLTVETTP